MTRERVIIFVIVVIILGALVNALVRADIIEISGIEIHEKDRLAAVEKDLKKLKVDESKIRYNKTDMIQALKTIGFEVTSDGEITSAVSPEGKGDILVNISGEGEINTLRIQARIRESKKDHDQINELYFKKIYELTGLSRAWLEESMTNLLKVGRSESFSIEDTLGGNMVSLEYNRGYDSYVFDAEFID